MLMAERHDPDMQDEFREDAHNLLKNVLAKNNEADDRRVSGLRAAVTLACA